MVSSKLGFGQRGWPPINDAPGGAPPGPLPEHDLPPPPGSMARTGRALNSGWPSDISELARLDALEAFELLDTPPEPEFDRVAHLAARLFHAPVAVICLIDEHRLWFKAKVGTDLDQVPRASPFCNQTIASPDIKIVLDARADPRFGAGGRPAGPLPLLCWRTVAGGWRGAGRHPVRAGPAQPPAFLRG